jgi:hypothetical protein
MSNYPSSGKRAREMNQARKRQEKAAERADKRSRGPRDLPVVTADEVNGNLPSIEDAMRAIENPGSIDRTAAGIRVRLFVGSLSESTTAADLRTAFGAFGVVADAVVMVERDTGASRGFGFVTMASRKDAPRAIEALHGSELNGRSIVVNLATERR